MLCWKNIIVCQITNDWVLCYDSIWVNVCSWCVINDLRAFINELHNLKFYKVIAKKQEQVIAKKGGRVPFAPPPESASVLSLNQKNSETELPLTK